MKCVRRSAICLLALLAPVSAGAQTGSFATLQSPAGSLQMQPAGGPTTLGGMIFLPGGAWGSGALSTFQAPLYQNQTFTGSVPSSPPHTDADYGAFLQQTDAGGFNGNAGTGFTENLIVNSQVGTSQPAMGDRLAGMFKLWIQQTNNPANEGYTALTGYCGLDWTDIISGANNGSVCFGMNAEAALMTGITGSVVGMEVDTSEQAGSKPVSRIGLQIGDNVSGAGVQAAQDDVALTINNQYDQGPALGYRVGIEFGRAGGWFPVSTTGTMIGAQNPGGTPFTVGNGIDWHLGMVTGDWLNLGDVFKVNGSGAVTAESYAAGPTAGVSCPAGTVDLATLTIVGGIVTHC